MIVDAKKKVILTIVIIFVLGGCSTELKSTVVGWYLKSGDTNLIISQDGAPIAMGDESKKGNLFEGLRNGDKIEITCGAIRESYPGGTEVYSCKLIEKGDISDIPNDTLDKLQEMGWQF